MRSEQRKFFDQINNLIIPADPLLRRCVDSRYLLGTEGTGGIALAGADMCIVMAILKWAQKHKFRITGQDALYITKRAIEASSGGREYFYAHTDTHEQHTGKFGCGHIHHAMTDGKKYGLPGSEVRNALEEVNQLARYGQAKLITLSGNHNEKLVVINDAQHRTLISSGTNDSSPFFLFDRARTRSFIHQVVLYINENDSVLRGQMNVEEILHYTDEQLQATLGKLGADRLPTIIINPDSFFWSAVSVNVSKLLS